MPQPSIARHEITRSETWSVFHLNIPYVLSQGPFRQPEWPLFFRVNQKDEVTAHRMGEDSHGFEGPNFNEINRAPHRVVQMSR